MALSNFFKKMRSQHFIVHVLTETPLFADNNQNKKKYSNENISFGFKIFLNIFSRINKQVISRSHSHCPSVAKDTFFLVMH